MSPISQVLIEKKLLQMAERIGHLEGYSRAGWEAYRNSLERRKATEKLLQELIETAIDINTHVAVEKGVGVPHDYHSSFLKLGELGVIPAELAARLAPSAGLRNRLVHQYSAVDDQKIFRFLSHELKSFSDYISAVRAQLPTL